MKQNTVNAPMRARLTRGNRVGRIVATGIAFALAAGTFAVAASEGGPSVVVHYADLNLQSPAGMDTLRSRIRHAARQVCTSSHANERNRLPARDACVKLATENALAQVEPPRG